MTSSLRIEGGGDCLELENTGAIALDLLSLIFIRLCLQ